MSPVLESDQVVEALTQKAVTAAETGQWDQVVKFYEERENSGHLAKVSPEVAKKLIKCDQWVMTRIREVQALTKQALGEAQEHRRRLEGVKRQWLSQQTTQTHHRLSI